MFLVLKRKIQLQRDNVKTNYLEATQKIVEGNKMVLEGNEKGKSVHEKERKNMLRRKEESPLWMR